MRTERCCAIAAALLVLQLLVLASLPFELREPMDTVVHVLAYASLTVMLWIATDGRRPMLVVAGAMALGLAGELRQAFIPARSAQLFDFLAGALAAGAAGALLYWKQGARKPCAESSAPSRGATSSR